MIKVETSVKSPDAFAAKAAAIAALPAKAMQAIALVFHENAMDAFRAEADPWGVPWKKHSPTTMKIKARGGLFSKGVSAAQSRRLTTNAKLLIDKGTLRNAVVPYATATETGISVGGPAQPYARVHQLGNPDNRLPNTSRGRRAPIPARPFLPIVYAGGKLAVVLPPKVTDQIAQILAMLLKGGA